MAADAKAAEKAANAKAADAARIAAEGKATAAAQEAAAETQWHKMDEESRIKTTELSDARTLEKKVKAELKKKDAQLQQMIPITRQKVQPYLRMFSEAETLYIGETKAANDSSDLVHPEIQRLFASILGILELPEDWPIG